MSNATGPPPSKRAAEETRAAELAAQREAWRIADQEAKLVTRRELAHTKAMEASWSKNTLPQLATGGSAR